MTFSSLLSGIAGLLISVWECFRLVFGQEHHILFFLNAFFGHLTHVIAIQASPCFDVVDIDTIQE